MKATITRAGAALMLAGFAAAVAGCGQEPAVKTYPVTGTVVYEGGAPLAGGSISFKAVNGPASGTAVIKEDGTFSLRTLQRDSQFNGAAPGDYQVSVLPPIPAERKRAVVPITLNKKFHVQAGENQFQIVVPPPRGRL